MVLSVLSALRAPKGACPVPHRHSHFALDESAETQHLAAEEKDGEVERGTKDAWPLTVSTPVERGGRRWRVGREEQVWERESVRDKDIAEAFFLSCACFPQY